MLLDLKELIVHSGEALPFDFELDLSELDFHGTHPIVEPVHVTGQVRNHAGLLMMTGTAVTNLHVNCDRCGKPFQRVMELPFEHMLADHLEDEENDEIVLLDGSVLNADDVIEDDFVYGMDTSDLCKEDCKGRCFRCGADLNEGECKCKPEIDPRMAVLAKLLEKQD